MRSPELSPVQGEIEIAGSVELGTVFGIRVVECGVGDQLGLVPVEPPPSPSPYICDYPSEDSHVCVPTRVN